MASDIVRQADADEHQEEIIRNHEIYEDFLTREVNFNVQLLSALALIEGIHKGLDHAEQLIGEWRILDGLRALEGRLRRTLRQSNG